MKRQTVKRLMTKGIVTYVAVFALVLMVAMPAMALVAARNSVNRRSIIDGEVTYKDIGKGQVRTSELGPKSVRYGKIAGGAVRSNHIKDGNVRSADIGNGTILNEDISGAAAISASKINRTGLNADMVDGSHASAFAGAGHNHDSDYIEETGPQSISDTLTVSGLSYDSTKAGVLSIPNSAFETYNSSSTFSRNAVSLFMKPGSSSGYFYAPVYLPQGAVITKLRYYHLDNSTSYTYASMYKISHTGGSVTMANTGHSVNSPGWQTLTDSSINYATIDNSSNAYSARIYLSGENVTAGNIVIDYTYTSPGS